MVADLELCVGERSLLCWQAGGPFGGDKGLRVHVVMCSVDQPHASNLSLAWTAQQERGEVCAVTRQAG